MTFDESLLHCEGGFEYEMPFRTFSFCRLFRPLGVLCWFYAGPTLIFEAISKSQSNFLKSEVKYLKIS